MKIYMFWIFLFLSFFPSSAQTTFENVISNTTGDIPSSVFEQDDGYLVCLRGDELSIGLRGIVLIKTDLNGNVVWRKFTGKPNYVYSPGYTGSMIQTNDGGFAIGGHFSNIPITEKYALLVRLNSNGDTLWTQNYGSPGRYIFINQIRQTNDGGFLLFGDSDDSDPLGDYCLIKTDSLGNFQWKKTYGGNESEIGISVDVTKNNEFLLCGASRSFNSPNQMGYYLKVDSLGQVIYDKTYGTSGNNRAASMTKLQNDEFLLWGGLDTVVNNTEYQWARFIAKFDTSGNQIWRTFLGKEKRCLIWQVREMPDGSIVFIGEAVYQGINEDAGWIGKLDANGNLLWERFHIYKEREFFKREVLFSGDIQQTKDGGYVITGVVWRQQDTTQSSVNNTMIWLVKLDSMGCLNGDCGIPVGVNEISGNAIHQNLIKAYPNPSQNILYIESISQNQHIENIQIIDIDGRNLSQSEQSPINTSELSQGIYFYQVEMSDGKLVRGKFVKQ